MVSVNDIAAWRERIFASLLPIILAVGTASTVLIIPFLVQRGMWSVVVADAVTLVWIFGIWKLKTLSYNVRVLHFLAVVYLLSIVLLLTVGAATLNYLMAPPLIAVILLSLRLAFLALGLGAVSLVALGATGYINPSIPGWEHDPLTASLVAALNYTTIGVLLTLVCSQMLKGLSRSLAELQLTSTAVSRLNDMVIIAQAADLRNSAQPITFVNEAFLRRTGYTREEIIGKSLSMLQGPATNKAVIARISQSMLSGKPYSAEMMSYTKSGTPFWIELELMPFTQSGDRASHWVVVGRDITERRTAADAMHRLAFYDVLTGLPNRRLLTDRLRTAIVDAQAGRGLSAVLYLDLDNFKSVNDARGHMVGDVLLSHVAARLSRTLRGSDLVARIGGDEFIVMLGGLSSDPSVASRVALDIAHNIRSALGAPLDLDGQPYSIAASIGIALSAGSGNRTPQDLLREADTAMHRAKAGGTNTAILFENAMLSEAQHKLKLERDLAQAIENDELAMHLQLQVDHHGAPVGAEMLMRWYRADGTAIRPDIFIPIAESSGIIVQLGNWALLQACKAWSILKSQGWAMPLSVNVSPLQFRQPEFVEKVSEVLLETGVPAEQLIFEVTEGLLIEDIEQAIKRMQDLASMGIRFSVDDFGTGYSNLAYLAKMPLYELKIDKRFIRDTPHDINSTAIVNSILAMAEHLGLRVVAEGIECEEQAHYLANHKQVYMQGYLYHRPMELDHLIDWLRAKQDETFVSEAIPAIASAHSS